MAQRDRNNVLVRGELAVGQRNIGGLLGQLEAANLTRTEALAILRSVGLPESAYDDPSFPLSLEEDFEILNAIRKRLWADVSMEVGVFRVALVTRAFMFGALGLAWQSAPTVLDAVNVSIQYPQINWGRSRMILEVSPREERIIYEIDRVPAVFSRPEELAETCKYALLLDISVGVALMLDIVADRSLLLGVHLPYARPGDWDVVADLLPFPVKFDAPVASAVFAPGLSSHVPKRSHPLSFKLAMKLLENESALFSDDVGLPERVKRWLWSATPPPKKSEVAKGLGMAERSLTRRLAAEGVTFNELLAEVQSERAKNLLSNGALTIAQVAYRVGYSDPAAFTRAFTGWCGVSPSSWRKRSDGEST